MASHLFCAMAVRVDGGQTSLHGNLGKDYHLMRSALRTALFSLTLIAAFSAPANALETIFGNPGITHAGLELYGSGFDSLAQGFKMGAGKSYELDSVEVGLFFPSSAAFSMISVGLYANSGGSPTGSALVTFDNPDFSDPVSPAVYTFGYTGTRYTLAADATYWLVVNYTGDAETLFTWEFAETDALNPSTTGRFYTPTAGTSGSGITYVDTKGYDSLTPAQGWVSLSSGGTNYRGLRYAIVPEPSTYALGAIGTLVMGAVARRKSRKSVSV